MLRDNIREFAEVLRQIGIELPHFVGGAATGAVRAIVLKTGSLWGYVSSVLTGAATASYLGPSAVFWLQLPNNSKGELAAIFMVGLAGMTVVETCILIVKQRLPGAGNAKD